MTWLLIVLILIIVVITILPPRYDPTIRLHEWLVRRRNR